MSNKPLEGIRPEVAMYGFVPSAGAVLAEWGAEVIKVEHAVTGTRSADCARPIARSRVTPTRTSSMRTAASAASVCRWAPPRAGGAAGTGPRRRSPDQLLPGHRAKFDIDVDAIRAVNPNIIYARGSAFGPRGEEAVKGGYDMTAFWCRAGTAASITPDAIDGMIGPPGPAYGDTISGTNLAGGIAAALFRRRTHR